MDSHSSVEPEEPARSVAHLAVLLASLAVAWAIGEAIPVWAGLASVTAALGIVAVVLYSRGREPRSRPSGRASQVEVSSWT